MSYVDFHPPNYRAGASDLTVAISPLGLVELSDEEFEVHGPRLNRYATNWAMYLGHHWTYKRPEGESQLTFNYCKAFADYINSFTFGEGVRFLTPKATEAIVPGLLQRVWDIDNDKLTVLHEMGQQGGVSGDCFVKVAYEEPNVDTIGRIHPGRVRLLVLNAAHCYPEWHPHDRERMIRFKLKYRFWGTLAEGTRQVFTYTEIITEAEIVEYVNDQEIPNSRRPNPLGVVPVVHIANRKLSGSPWGISDIHDITTLNREYNEKATDVSDIINYHAEPVTIVTGAKVAQLEMGANKVWGGLPHDAKVYNLEIANGGVQAGIAYLTLLKQSMHEMVGVPEGALGQRQPISNTSGVALALQFMPLMNVWKLKTIQYGNGLSKINAIVILTLVIKEPQVLVYNPTTEAELKPGQYPQLDPMDPLTYQNEVQFSPPLPTDVLILLNELQMKMLMGLESKRGALKELGEEYPDEKMREIIEELRQDAMDQGSLDLLRAHIVSTIMQITGTVPEGGDVTSASAEGGDQKVTQAGRNEPRDSAGGRGSGDDGSPRGPRPGVMPDGTASADPRRIAEALVTQAFGPRVAMRKNPDTPG